MKGRITRGLFAIFGCSLLTTTGCAFGGLNSLPLPGSVGHGADASVYHVQMRNVATLEPNSPVMIGDVVVGSIRKISVRNWLVTVDVTIESRAVVPANAVASIGQTSLLGSLHMALDPPAHQLPTGRLQPGSTIGLDRSFTYPSTEQTLASLSLFVNSGGVGQVGDIIHSFNAVLSGREDQVRDLLGRVDTFLGTLNAQRDKIIGTIESLNRLAATFAAQDTSIDRALDVIPPARKVLTLERSRMTAALDKLRTFSDTTTTLINDSKDDLVSNLSNLEPTLRALAEVGPELGSVVAAVPTWPYTQDFIDRAFRGDYMNLWTSLDLTYSRMKRTFFLGTRWGEEGAPLVPAPGEPAFRNYTYDPLNSAIAAPAPPPTDATSPAPVFAGPYSGAAVPDPTQGGHH